MPSPSSFPPALSRRAALLGAVAVGTAACTPYTVEPDRPSTLPGRPVEEDPDIALAATVLADERDVLSRVEATVAAHPRLGRVLADARAGHEAHIALLEQAVPEQTSDASPSASASVPPPSPSQSPAQPEPRIKVPADPRRALAAVARREEELSLTGRRSAFSAESGAFARVLAAMAAGAAQQAAVLSNAQVPRGRR